MKKIILIVLGLVAVSFLLVSLNGKITGEVWKVPRSCKETDGGNVPDKQGTVEFKGLSSAKKTTVTDVCKDARTLLEHFCDGEVHLTETIPCRYRCESGACETPLLLKK